MKKAELIFIFIMKLTVIGFAYFSLPYFLSWIFDIPIESFFNHPSSIVFNIAPIIILCIGIWIFYRARKEAKGCD